MKARSADDYGRVLSFLSRLSDFRLVLLFGIGA